MGTQPDSPLGFLLGIHQYNCNSQQLMFTYLLDVIFKLVMSTPHMYFLVYILYSFSSLLGNIFMLCYVKLNNIHEKIIPLKYIPTIVEEKQ